MLSAKREPKKWNQVCCNQKYVTNTRGSEITQIREITTEDTGTPQKPQASSIHVLGILMLVIGTTLSRYIGKLGCKVQHMVGETLDNVAKWYSSYVNHAWTGAAEYCRKVDAENDEFMENFVPWANGYSIKEIENMQKSDADIEQIYRWKQEGKLPPGDILTAASMEVRHYALCWDALEMKSGILCRKFDKQNGTGSFSQMIVPRSLRNDVLHQMHNSLLSGHLGQKKTKEKILQKYYWFKIREDINLWIAQ